VQSLQINVFNIIDAFPTTLRGGIPKDSFNGYGLLRLAGNRNETQKITTEIPQSQSKGNSDETSTVESTTVDFGENQSISFDQLKMFVPILGVIISLLLLPRINYLFKRCKSKLGVSLKFSRSRQIKRTENNISSETLPVQNDCNKDSVTTNKFENTTLDESKVSLYHCST